MTPRPLRAAAEPPVDQASALTAIGASLTVSLDNGRLPCRDYLVGCMHGARSAGRDDAAAGPTATSVFERPPLVGGRGVRRIAAMGYVYDAAWRRERRRLDALAALYDPGTIAVLSRLGVDRGWRCWEIAAGSGTIARWLAERLGSGGELLVTDLDPRFVESLRDHNVMVSRHDVRSDPPAVGAFDLVHARAVLAHVCERQRAIDAMVRALRPGGWLVVEDVVFAPRSCDPPLVALERTDAAFRRVLQATDVDPDYGLKIPAAFEQAGLVEIGHDARVPLARTGTTDIELLALTLEHLRPRLETDGALAADDLDQTLRALHEPGRTLRCAHMVAAWGRRPASA